MRPLILCVLSAALAILVPGAPSAQELVIYNIEVGLDSSSGSLAQGDSAFIRFPDGRTMLIDGGNAGNNGGQSVLALFNRLGFSGPLDYVVTTHYHSDHMDGLVTVCQSNGYRYRPAAYGSVYDIGGSSGSTSYDSVFQGRRITPAVGDTLAIGDCTVTFVSVNGRTYGGGYINPGTDQNNTSIGVLIRYGGFDYLSLGDLGEAWENNLSAALRDENRKIDLLKASHHGASDSTSNSFVFGILPEYAVISVGNGNGFGHPHQYALNHLNAKTDSGSPVSPSYTPVVNIFCMERGDGATAGNVVVVGNGSADPAQQGSLKTRVYNYGNSYDITNEGPNTNGISLIGIPCDEQGDFIPVSVAEWTMFRHDAMRTGKTPLDGPSSPCLKWSYAAAAAISSSPAVSAAETVYVGGEDNVLYSLDSAGRLLWSYETAAPVRSSAAVGTDTVYVGSDDGRLYSLLQTGILRWSYAFGEAISSSPTVSMAETVYVGGEDNVLYGLDLDGALLWSYNTGGPVRSSVAVGTDTVYVGADDGRLYSLLQTGALQWSYASAAAISSSPAMSATETVYVGGEDNVLYSFDPVGGLLWSYKTGGAVRSSAAVSDETVYVGSNDGNFYALGQTGELQWSYASAAAVSSSPVASATGTVYVGGEDSVLYGFGPAGTLLWSYATGGAVRSSIAIGTDTVYVGSDDHRLYVIAGVLPEPTPTPSGTASSTPTPTAPSGTPTPTRTPTATPTSPLPSPTNTPTRTPTIAPTPPSSPTPTPVLSLVPNKTVVETGDSLVMDLAINERVSGMGELVAYLLVQAPGGPWFSFVPGKGGGFVMVRGIKPAASSAVIPPLNATILKQKIGASLSRGNYWFAAAIFHAGGGITLDNWRDLAIYSSETTVTVR